MIVCVIYSYVLGMIRNRLRGRASQVLVGLGRYLKRQSIDGLVEKVLLHQGMRAYHISLTPEVYANVIIIKPVYLCSL